MKKIRYNIMHEIRNPLNEYLYEKKYISMYCMLDKFMETNPPCKECLVQPVCVFNLIHKDLPYPYLYIKLCDDLKEFVTHNKIFTDNEIATKFKKNIGKGY